jgi:hypothetical protein
MIVKIVCSLELERFFHLAVRAKQQTHQTRREQGTRRQEESYSRRSGKPGSLDCATHFSAIIADCGCELWRVRRVGRRRVARNCQLILTRIKGSHVSPLHWGLRVVFDGFLGIQLGRRFANRMATQTATMGVAEVLTERKLARWMETQTVTTAVRLQRQDSAQSCRSSWGLRMAAVVSTEWRLEQRLVHNDLSHRVNETVRGSII